MTFAVLTTPIAILSYIVVAETGLIIYGLRSLITGVLRTGREAQALEKRAETAEAASRVRDDSLNQALMVLPEVSEVLKKFHVAAETTTTSNEEAAP